nr:hypothetical protein CFP56_43677 [Quercus suber]
MLEPSHYALGGTKALPYKHKLGSKIHPSRSFVETVKAPIQVRKHSQQPSIREEEKIQAVESTLPPPRDESWNQVVAFEVPADNAKPIVVGGVKGSDHAVNGETKIKEKNPEQNKFRFPLNNLNLKDVDFGWERQFRRSIWLGKGLTVEVNEFGKRRVSSQCYRGNKQAVKWVARGANSSQDEFKGMDHVPSEAHAPWLGESELAYPLSHLADIDSGSGPGDMRAEFATFSTDICFFGAGGGDGAVIWGPDRKSREEVVLFGGDEG